jgi:hypothetical protein
MKRHLMNRFVVLGLVVGYGSAGAPLGAQTSVAGEAYGSFVRLGGTTTKSATATLPDTGGMAAADLDFTNAPGALSSGWVSTTSTGASGALKATSQSTAAVEDVNVLGGLITARTAIAVASSYATGAGVASDAAGSTVTDLVVNGMPVAIGDAAFPPNTRIALPGVGYVILNEQQQMGDGVQSSGVTVNLIHVYLQNALTGAITGEIVVASARSAVGF